MDQNVKRMLKLIEEGDSFAKKAEMYYQKRPKLINHVEEFYSIYRSLAERYDHVTGELRKNVPSDLQSQGSGVSDVGSESSFASPSQDQGLRRHKSRPRAAGFEFFLGSGGSGSDLCNKDGDESSTLDSESEMDDSSVVNYSGLPGDGSDQVLHRNIIDLEVELCEVNEKLWLQLKDNSDGSFRGEKSMNSDVLLAKIAAYGEELRVAKEENLLSKQKIALPKTELQKHKSVESKNDLARDLDTSQEDAKTLGCSKNMEENQANKLEERNNELEAGVSEQQFKIASLSKALRITQEKLENSEKEVASLRHEREGTKSSCQRLQDQLGSAQKEIHAWKNKVDREKREVSKLQDRIGRYKANLSDRDQEIRGLKEAISNANKSLSEENSYLQDEITKLLKERSYLQDTIKEWDFRCQSLEEDVRRVNAEKREIECVLGGEVVQFKLDIAKRDVIVEELNKNLDSINLNYELLMMQRDELNAKVDALTAEMDSKDDCVNQVNSQLHQLHMEHAELIAGTEKAHKLVKELRIRIEELENEIERHQELIQESAEEKREAIRQLCFSLEHYRNGYHELRQAFIVHKRLPVMAS